MAAPISLQAVQGTLQLPSHFVIGKNNLHSSLARKLSSRESRVKVIRRAGSKFNLSEIMGGRGLCNGEQGLQQELKRSIEISEMDDDDAIILEVEEEVKEEESSGCFEKELMGLTGGFPGGEKGLKKFIQENPPLITKSVVQVVGVKNLSISTKLKAAPELPLLMPGMIAIVKNPNNPFYMYCGIVQRITDGKAGVLFEGGNWDRLITFRLDELQRRDKGPPAKNPKSCIIEPQYRNQSL